MPKILFGTLVAGLAISCAMEESDSGTLTIDPNSAEIHTGVSAEDVDHNNDGIIDIRDVVIVASFIGQEVEAEEEATAELCPAGWYRDEEKVKKVVGYHKDWFRKARNDAPIPTDSSGRRLEERHEESCVYLYPNSGPFGEGIEFSKPPDEDCLVSCGGYQGLLCSQTEKVYARCNHRCTPINRRYPVPIKHTAYIQSDDPTKCQLGMEKNKQYLFPHPNGNDFYTYALLAMHRVPNKTDNPNVNQYNDLVFGNTTYRTWLAVRFLVSRDGNISRLKELKIKNGPSERGIRNYDGSDIEIFEFSGDSDNITYAIKGRIGKIIYSKNGFPYDVSESATVYNDNINYIGPLEESWGQGIQIGNPSKIDSARSDYFIMKLQFRLAPSYHLYRWVAGIHGQLKFRFPEDVRAQYFPEDITN